MEPMVPTPLNRMLAGAAGFVTGIIAQILFAALVNSIIGSVPGLWSTKMLVWVVILLIPPILSYKFLVVAPGSVKEDYIRGVQLGALFWFLWILVATYLV